MLIQGEPGWICLMICNADVLFSTLVLHFVTTNDHQPFARPNSDCFADVGSNIRTSPNMSCGLANTLDNKRASSQVCYTSDEKTIDTNSDLEGDKSAIIEYPEKVLISDVTRRKSVDSEVC